MVQRFFEKFNKFLQYHRKNVGFIYTIPKHQRGVMEYMYQLASMHYLQGMCFRVHIKELKSKAITYAN